MELIGLYYHKAIQSARCLCPELVALNPLRRKHFVHGAAGYRETPRRHAEKLAVLGPGRRECSRSSLNVDNAGDVAAAIQQLQKLWRSIPYFRSALRIGAATWNPHPATPRHKLRRERAEPLSR